MSDGITATVSGEDALARAIEEQLRGTAQSAVLALVVEAASVAADAKRRSPVASGKLRGSIRVAPKPGGASVVCGGPEVPYAVAVHERMDIEHPTGEAKFLEHALNQAAGSLAQNVADRTKIGG